MEIPSPTPAVVLPVSAAAAVKEDTSLYSAAATITGGLAPSIVLLGVGLFVVQSGGLSGLPVALLLKDKLHLSPGQLATFTAITGIPLYIKPLVGLITDSFPIGGLRRRPYLLLASLCCAVLWLAVGFLPHTYYILLTLLLFVSLATITVGNTVGGLMVEIGQQHTATGRLGSLRGIVTEIGAVLSGVGGGWLATRALGWTGGILSGFWFLLVITGWGLLHEKRRSIATDKTRAAAFLLLRSQVKTLFHARDFWIVVATVFLINVSPGFGTPLLYFQTNTLHFTPPFIGLLQSVAGVGGLVGAITYGFLCQRLRPTNILTFLVITVAAGTLGYLFYGSKSLALILAGGSGLFGSMAFVCMFDLAARATPKQAATVGYALILSTVNLTAAVSDLTGSWLNTRYGWSFHNLVWLNAGTSLLAVFILLFLPRSLTDKREGASKIQDTPVPATF